MNFLLLNASSNFKKSLTVIVLPAVTLGSVLVVGAVEPLWCSGVLEFLKAVAILLYKVANRFSSIVIVSLQYVLIKLMRRYTSDCET